MSEQTVLVFRPFLKATHYQLHTGLYAAAFEAERESLHSSIRRLFYTVAKHIGLWDVKPCPPSVWRARPPPRANALPKYEPSIDYSYRGVGSTLRPGSGAGGQRPLLADF